MGVAGEAGSEGDTKFHAIAVVAGADAEVAREEGATDVEAGKRTGLRLITEVGDEIEITKEADPDVDTRAGSKASTTQATGLVAADGVGGVVSENVDVFVGLLVESVFERADNRGLIGRGMFVVAIPGITATEHVGKGPGRIGAGAEDLVAEVMWVALHEGVGKVFVEGVFSDKPECADHRSDDEIDPTGVVGDFVTDFVTFFAVDGVGEASLVEDGSFPEWADLPLGGESGGP